jgi:hypothetical protein
VLVKRNYLMLKPGDKVLVKVVKRNTEEFKRLLQSGWRLLDLSDDAALLLQPQDPDEEQKQ